MAECKTCKKQLSRSAYICPDCGTKQNRFGIFHFIIIAFIIMVVIGVVTNPVA